MTPTALDTAAPDIAGLDRAQAHRALRPINLVRARAAMAHLGAERCEIRFAGSMSDAHRVLAPKFLDAAGQALGRNLTDARIDRLTLAPWREGDSEVVEVKVMLMNMLLDAAEDLIEDDLQAWIAALEKDSRGVISIPAVGDMTVTLTAADKTPLLRRNLATGEITVLVEATEVAETPKMPELELES